MGRIAIKKGDKVAVIAGKDRGKKGKVIRVLLGRQRVVVEGVAIVKRHTRPTQKNPQGGIMEHEAAIHISNVQLICPNCGAQTRIGHRFAESGVKVRVCKKCGGDIDKA
jgi:large subunit ribosomal protein L24